MGRRLRGRRAAFGPRRRNITQVEVSVHAGATAILFGVGRAGGAAFVTIHLYGLGGCVVGAPAGVVLSDGIGVVIEAEIMAQAICLVDALV